MQMNIMQEQKTTHTTPAESTRPERRCYSVLIETRYMREAIEV